MMSAAARLISQFWNFLLGMFTSHITGEIAVRSALVALVVSVVVGTYALYRTLVNALSIGMPAEFAWAFMLIPDNFELCITALTDFRIALYIASWKLGTAGLKIPGR